MAGTGRRFVRGDRIRMLREARGWTQSDLAQRCGISQSHISEIEAGKPRSIRSGSLYALSRVLRSNLAYIAGTGGDPRPRDKAKLGDLEFTEAELLSNYRALKTTQSRAILRQVAEGLVKAEKESPPEAGS